MKLMKDIEKLYNCPSGCNGNGIRYAHCYETLENWKRIMFEIFFIAVIKTLN